MIKKIIMRVSVPGPSQDNQTHETKDTLYLAALLLPILCLQLPL
jgi:hypothetical protein